jgi:hypothetical protein
VAGKNMQNLANILCPKITKKVAETKIDENQDPLTLEQQKGLLCLMCAGQRG